jgi:hypothetical protein
MPANRPPGRDAEGGPGCHTRNRQPASAPPPPQQQGPDAARVARSGDNGRTCQAPRCARSLPRGRRRFCSDLCRVRGQRAERRYDDGELGEAVIRLIEALARRGEFASVLQIRAAADRIAADAIDQLRAEGFSWAALADAAGVSRQALSQWHKRRSAQPGVNTAFTREAR